MKNVYFNHVLKIFIYPKQSLASVQSQIPKAFFTEIEQTIPKFVWNYKRSQIVKAILRRKLKAGGNTFLGFEVYYKYILIKTVGKNRHLGQWNTI